MEAKTFIVTGAEGEQWAVHCPHKRYVELVERVQVQWGSQATEYAAPRIEQFSVGETISALPGVNHIFADAGEVTVTGKADPSALIHQLTDAILSLGGNV